MCYLNVVMVEILLLFSLVHLPSSSLGDTVWQVWNSSSYCSNNKLIYSCVSDSPGINWDISEQGRLIASWSVSHFTNNGRLLRESEPIEAVLEVTYSNSTFIASTIKLTISMDLQIQCNNIIAKNIQRSSLTDPLPTTIQVTVISNSVSISWNNTWDEYAIEEYSSSDEVIKNWSTNNIQIPPFNLSTNTVRVRISICPYRHIPFIVGISLFKDENNHYARNYFIVHINNTSWELIGANTSKTIRTFFNSNGSWENIEIFKKEPASSTSHVTETELNMVNTSQLTSSQNEQNLTQQGYDTTGDNPMDSNSPLTANNLSLILVLSITPVGLVLLTSSIILVVIPAGIWTYRKKSENLNIGTEDAEVATYEQLNNFPYRGSSSAIGTPGHQPSVKLDSEQDYSTLKHIKQSLPPSMDYDTINGVKPHRYKRNQQLQYAEIRTCTQCGQAKPFEDYKVNYTNICTQEGMADEQLNLHTLSAQLGPISESFIAFGSVAGVSPASLSEIVVKSASYNDSMSEVCGLWLKKCQQEQTQPTWHMVAEILDLIGHKEFSKKLMQVYNKGTLPAQIDNSSPVVVSETKELPLSSADNKVTKNESEENPGCSRNDEELWSDEAPPIPPFNPQCLSCPESMPPQYEDVQVIALRPIASGNHPQSKSEDVTTFTGTSNKVSEAVGMENL